MPRNEEFLTIIARMRDETRRVISRIGRNIQRLKDRVNRAFISMRRAAFFVTAAIVAIGLAIAQLVKPSSEFEESLAKFQVVFGKFALETAAWADTFAESVRRSRASVVGFLSTFQDTFVPLGFARQEAAELSKALTKLTFDVASFNDKSASDVARDFQSALVGNTETVRKYGIVLTEESTKLAAYAAGIAEVGVELTAIEKVQARLLQIQGQTTDAQGDLIRTADSFSNSMRSLSDQILDVRIGLGFELQKVILSSIEAFGGVDNVVNAVKLVLSAFVGVVKVTAAALAPLISGLGKLVKAISEGGVVADVLAGKINALQALTVVFDLALETMRIGAKFVFGQVVDLVEGARLSLSLLVHELQAARLDFEKLIALRSGDAQKFALLSGADFAVGKEIEKIKERISVLANRDFAERGREAGQNFADAFRRALLNFQNIEGAGAIGGGLNLALLVSGAEAAVSAAQKSARALDGAKAGVGALGAQFAKLAVDIVKARSDLILFANDASGGFRDGINRALGTVREFSQFLGGQLVSGSFSAFRQFFNDLQDDSVKTSEAIRSFAQNFIRNLQDILSQLLAFRAVRGIFGAFGFGGLLGQSVFQSSQGQQTVTGASLLASTAASPGATGSGGGSQVGGTVINLNPSFTINGAIDGRSIAALITTGEAGRAMQDMLADTLATGRNQGFSRMVRFA